MTQYKKWKVMLLPLIGMAYVSSASASPTSSGLFNYTRYLFRAAEKPFSTEQFAIGKQWDCFGAKYGEPEYVKPKKKFRFITVSTDAGPRLLDIDVDSREDTGAIWNGTLDGLQSVESENIKCNSSSQKTTVYHKRALRTLYASDGIAIEKMVSKSGSCGTSLDSNDADNMKGSELPNALSDDGYYAEEYLICQLHRDGDQ